MEDDENFQYKTDLSKEVEEVWFKKKFILNFYSISFFHNFCQKLSIEEYYHKKDKNLNEEDFSEENKSSNEDDDGIAFFYDSN